MTRAIFVVSVFLLTLGACTQKVVCPAYQSAFIYDKEALRKKFSYMQDDSTPRVFASASSKNKYLLGVPTSYKKKERSLKTVAMVPVLPVVPDSLQEGFEKEVDTASVERNVYDSTAVLRIDTLAQETTDSVYVISKEREVRVLKYDPMKRKYFVDTIGFNMEQDSYMWYLRDVLVLPDARLAKLGGKEEEAEKGEKVKKGGFFKNLFGKKKKTTVEPDSTQSIKAEEEDYGYDEFEGKVKDSTQVQPVPDASAAKTKKSEKKKKSDKKKDIPPAKKEEEDDGF